MPSSTKAKHGTVPLTGNYDLVLYRNVLYHRVGRFQERSQSNYSEEPKQNLKLKEIFK
jgi:hypothetical protein